MGGSMSERVGPKTENRRGEKKRHTERGRERERQGRRGEREINDAGACALDYTPKAPTATRVLRIHSAPQICRQCGGTRSAGGDRLLRPKRSWGFALCFFYGQTLFFSRTQSSS